MAVSWKRLAYTSQIRELLTAARTYYVRKDGNDSNTGLADTGGGAFLTIQKAVDVIRGPTLDFGGQDVTIQVRVGTYQEVVEITPWTGGGTLSIIGDVSTPSNVVIDGNEETTITLSGNLSGAVYIGGFKLSDCDDGISIGANGNITLGPMEYGAAAGVHIYARSGAASVFSDANYTISGGAASHWGVQYGARIYYVDCTITLTGTPDFSEAFLLARQSSLVKCPSLTFSGAATGSRYLIYANGVCDTEGAGASYLPGDSAGTTNTGGVYV